MRDYGDMTEDELKWCDQLRNIIRAMPPKIEICVAAEHGIIDIFMTDGPPGNVDTIFLERESNRPTPTIKTQSKRTTNG